MRSFADFRRSQHESALASCSTREAVGHILDILRLDLLEAVRLPEFVFEDNLSFDSIYRRVCQDDYEDNRQLIEAVIAEMKCGLYDALVEAAGDALSEPWASFQTQLVSEIDKLIASFKTELTTAIHTGRTAPPAEAPAEAPAPAGRTGPTAPAKTSAGPTAPAKTSATPAGPGEAPAPEEPELPPIITPRRRPTPDAGSYHGAYGLPLPGTSRPKVGEFRPSPYGDFVPAGGVGAGLRRVFVDPIRNWLRTKTRGLRRLWHGDPTREHFSLIELSLSDNLDHLMVVIDKFRQDLVSLVTNKIGHFAVKGALPTGAPAGDVSASVPPAGAPAGPPAEGTGEMPPGRPEDGKPGDAARATGEDPGVDPKRLETAPTEDDDAGEDDFEKAYRNASKGFEKLGFRFKPDRLPKHFKRGHVEWNINGVPVDENIDDSAIHREFYKQAYIRGMGTPDPTLLASFEAPGRKKGDGRAPYSKTNETALMKAVKEFYKVDDTHYKNYQVVLKIAQMIGKLALSSQAAGAPPKTDLAGAAGAPPKTDLAGAAGAPPKTAHDAIKNAAEILKAGRAAPSVDSYIAELQKDPEQWKALVAAWTKVSGDKDTTPEKAAEELIKDLKDATPEESKEYVRNLLASIPKEPAAAASHQEEQPAEPAPPAAVSEPAPPAGDQNSTSTKTIDTVREDLAKTVQAMIDDNDASNESKQFYADLLKRIHEFASPEDMKKLSSDKDLNDESQYTLFINDFLKLMVQRYNHVIELEKKANKPQKSLKATIRQKNQGGQAAAAATQIIPKGDAAATQIIPKGDAAATQIGQTVQEPGSNSTELDVKQSQGNEEESVPTLEDLPATSAKKKRIGIFKIMDGDPFKELLRRADKLSDLTGLALKDEERKGLAKERIARLRQHARKMWDHGASEEDIENWIRTERDKVLALIAKHEQNSEDGEDDAAVTLGTETPPPVTAPPVTAPPVTPEVKKQLPPADPQAGLTGTEGWAALQKNVKFKQLMEVIDGLAKQLAGGVYDEEKEDFVGYKAEEAKDRMDRIINNLRQQVVDGDLKVSDALYELETISTELQAQAGAAGEDEGEPREPDEDMEEPDEDMEEPDESDEANPETERDIFQHELEKRMGSEDKERDESFSNQVNRMRKLLREQTSFGQSPYRELRERLLV